MVGLLASLTQLPFLVATCVLGGFALWGWRRSASTGALLMAIGCGARALGQLASVYPMAQLSRMTAAEYGRMAMLLGLFQSAGGAHRRRAGHRRAGADPAAAAGGEAVA